ncbi:MAG: DNA translocase FtsK [Patescibacteria group bacterium]
MRTKKIKPKLSLPKVIKSLTTNQRIENFPLKHYSYSTFIAFSTNPILFKIQYMNGDTIDTTCNISSVIGKAFHQAMQAYYSLININSDEQEAIKQGLEEGMKYLDEYNDGFIEFSSTVPNKQKAQEILAFAYNNYVAEHKAGKEEIIGCEKLIETDVEVEWRGEKLALPVKLKGYLDKIIQEEKKLKIIDYKTVRSFSDDDKIDGAKMIQAIQYYFLVAAEYKEAPYSMIYEEVKTTKNRDGSPQVRRYEIVYSDNELFFDFYFRLYDDMTRAINGEAVFVPNIFTFFDNEVSLISYIHRLDVEENAAKEMKKLRVNTITDLLKKKIQNAGNMRKFLQTAEKKFISAKNLNYNKMRTEQKIQTKLMEHGMMIQFDSMVEGNTVDLYRFNPSIGLKMSKLLSFSADIEQVVGVSGIRVLAPIPNTSLVGFEIPRKERIFPEITATPDGFNLAMGVDIMGAVYRFDITKAPHTLVAGATGSGKSVFLASILSQLSTLPKVELHLFDPKMVELSQFRSKAIEYYSDIESIYLALEQLVAEMNVRYGRLSEAGARNIDEYSVDMNYKFVVIDEFGDLIVGNKSEGELNFSKEIMKNILILAQKARACGIHLIIATQRPSTQIITGDIKANFPTKVAFRCAKATDSQVVLGESGAEKLLGKGDMIFSSDEGDVRLQGFKN